MDNPPGTPRRASVASVYDYYLGGDRNDDVDREFARRMISSVPEAPEVARLNRAFLTRAVRHCAAAGVRQFLDIGSAIPRVAPVHETAGEKHPDRRVVYVDVEPEAVAHGRDLLAGTPGVAMIQGDLREPDVLLAHDEVRRLIDFTEPVAVLMLGVLHYVADADRPRDLVARYREAMAPGSFLVVSHGTDDGAPERVRSMVDITAEGQTTAYMRARAEVAAFFTGFDLLDPGVVFLPRWRPDPGDPPASPRAAVMAFAGVGRLP
ncbi:SAM-dependent methyltransferase [Micromonospora olivasterospora]|uniref:O-methyltransferase involved in polyketide biosynthesis n=1 Tax=Micromonospora olivasterospora TaxID=1880 RepID=A0A562I2W9_MICOL|nr:SAM-dependent methyltransferase [Micromonospora olivasterospora]TWH65146.1 O-methyltransferase involved in polyketide biosynthesis [Micromonospora olivasterospora]